MHPRANTTQTCFFLFSKHAKTTTLTRRRAHCRIAIEGIAHAYTNLVSSHLPIIAYVCNTIDNPPHNMNACCKICICMDMKTQHGTKCIPCTHAPLHSTGCCYRHMRKATSDIMLAYVTAKQQWRQAQLSNAFFTRKTNQNKTWTIILSRIFVVRVQQDTFRVVDVDPSTRWRWAQLV